MAYNSTLETAKIESALLASLKTKKIEYNITQDKSSNYASLTEAIAAVDDDDYKVKGIVLTFYTGTDWVSKRYNGEDASGFATETNWVEVCNNTGQGGSTTADYGPYILPVELFGLISQSNVTSEQISSAIGGLDGLQAVINAAKDNRRIVFKGVFMDGILDGSFIELTSFLCPDDDSAIGFLSTMTVYAGIGWINYAIIVIYEKSTKQFTFNVLKSNINPN